MAHRAWLHWTYVSDLERGQQSPALDVTNRLARALGVPRSEFFARSRSRTASAFASRGGISRVDRSSATGVRWPRSLSGSLPYLIFAFAFRRSAQYFFMRADTAFRAAADIVRVRCVA